MQIGIQHLSRHVTLISTPARVDFVECGAESILPSFRATRHQTGLERSIRYTVAAVKRVSFFNAEGT